MKTLDKSEKGVYNIIIINSLKELPFEKYRLYTGDLDESIKAYIQKYTLPSKIYTFLSKPHNVNFIYFLQD